MNFYIPSTVAVAFWFATGLAVFGYTVKAYSQTAKLSDVVSATQLVNPAATVEAAGLRAAGR